MLSVFIAQKIYSQTVHKLDCKCVCVHVYVCLMLSVFWLEILLLELKIMNCEGQWLSYFGVCYIGVFF